jgi:hypothetical protein
VYEDIDTTTVGLDVSRSRDDILVLRQIDSIRQNTDCSRFEVFRKGLQCVQAPTQEAKKSVLGRQVFRNGFADAAARTRYDRNLGGG